MMGPLSRIASAAAAIIDTIRLFHEVRSKQLRNEKFWQFDFANLWQD